MNRRNSAGPYRVIRRFGGSVGRHVGRVYAAYNTDTGAPAVVVSPGDRRDWWPGGNWTVTLSSTASPPRLTLEATDGLSEQDLSNLPEEMTRLVAATADVARQPDGADHLVGPGGQKRRGRAAVLSGRMVRTVLAAAAVVGLAVVTGVLAEEFHRPAQELRQVAVEAEPSGFTFTGGQFPMAPMPAAPFDRQKRPPCDPTLEDEVRGGCWTRLNLRPPCPAKAYESPAESARGGQCYLPTLAEAKPGQSIRP